jgi:hypothetical protein
VAHEEEEERGGPEEVWRAKTRAAVQMLLLCCRSGDRRSFVRNKLPEACGTTLLKGDEEDMSYLKGEICLT